jgi:3-deoxy-D-manno-octulosonic-acid transferase
VGVILLYNILYSIAAVFTVPVIGLMLIFSAKRRKTFFKRLGLQALPKDLNATADGTKPIWIHALSVGEVFSAEPLVRAVRKRFPNAPLLFSATTFTGHQVARARFQSSAAAVFYFPFDFSFSVKRTAAEADPGLVIIVETDIWPNFLCEMKRRGVPVIFANARLSRRSYKGYRGLRFFMAPIFGFFSHICAQSNEDAECFRQLGIPSHRITVTGNIKFDQDIDGPCVDAVEALRRRLVNDGNRRVFLAGSTHEGEETILKNVFLRLKQRFPDLLLIIVPRNPDRVAAIRQEFQAEPLAVCLMRATHNEGHAGCFDVVLVDTVGHLKSLYALADIAFVGGSLVHEGGHNPLEPAAFSKPVLFGPDMSDFKEIARMLLKEKGGFQIQSADALFDAVRSLLDNPLEARAMGERAFRFFSSNRGATQRTVNRVASYIGQADAL